MQQQEQHQTPSQTQTQEMTVAEWSKLENASIFIKRIPSWVTKEMLENQLKDIGEIDRVHIVDVSPEKGEGRMAFVHFKKWYNNNVAYKMKLQIVLKNDNTCPVYIYHPETGEKYTLFVTFNRRPIPKSVYDNDQLTDMINKLNQENTLLKNEIQDIRKMMSDFMRIQYTYQPQPTMYYQPMVSPPPPQYIQPSFFVPEDGSRWIYFPPPSHTPPFPQKK